MIKRTFLFLFASVSIGLAMSLVSAKPVSAASFPYNPGYLISDKLFADSGSMSVSDIQTFLTSHGSGIANYSDTEDCSASPRYSTFTSFYNSHYHCGVKESAPQIIHDVAVAYQISPRAILATMQKEQSLVTDPTAPSQNMGAINCALGYDSCSDTVGLFHQVDWGTWQLRANIELMNGRSYWNYSPSAYPCSGATSLYSTGLYPDRSVTFANPGGHARTITLFNSSTAALYCYTPYVGPLSDTGYSGSYNFVISYEQWWGSTQGAYYHLDSQTNPASSIEFGHTSSATIVLNNDTAQSWYSDDCAAAQGVQPFRLMVLGYRNTAWADTSATVTSNGSPHQAWMGPANQLRMIDCQVAPGGIATFTIPVKAPEYQTSEIIYFCLVQDGIQVHDDQTLSFKVTSAPDYAYQVVSDNAPPAILPGDGYQMVFKLRNTGGETWYNDANKPNPGTPGGAIRLATSGYANSPFAYVGLGAGWLTQNQITMVEPSVAPGATGTFQAVIFAPYQQLTFAHNFRLVLDGVKFISGPTIPSTISIPQPVASYSVISRSGPSTMRSFQTADFKVVVKNTGNMIWRNLYRKVPSTSTQKPLRDVRMMSWAPGYHTSYFWNSTAEWMGTHNQITPSSLIVGPGEEATYNITFRAPPVNKTTYFNEQWTFVLDGQTVMPFQGLTFPITVSP